MTIRPLYATFNTHDVTDADERKKMTEVIRTFCDTQRRHFSERAEQAADGHSRIANFIRANAFELTIAQLDEEDHTDG